MKQTTEIKLHVTDYLDKAFKTLPVNANINKGRCGSGGTTIEIKTERPAIIVVPTKGTIICKCNKHPNLFAVMGNVTIKDIQDYLLSDIKNKKFMTTPDSFEKIIQAAEGIGMLSQLYEQFFLLIDESHAAITDAFRKKILIPFKYLLKFKMKSLISATPFKFSNPIINELADYKITFHEDYIGNITVIPTNAVDACVDHYIKNCHLIDGKLFFFYNSVKEIAEVIKRNKLKDCHVYCALKEENFDKLAEHLLAFQQEPETGKYAKVNFFTSKYFEGVDIIEENAYVFLVTDINKAHTKVGISNKGVQAIGRLRITPTQIIHITNHRNIPTMKTFEDFKNDYEIHTQKLINDYNSYIELCKQSGIEPIEGTSKPIERFVEIDEVTLMASFNIDKLDQVLNELAFNEEFNNLDGITTGWERSLYKVEVEPFTGKAIPKRRKSKADQLKEFVETIDDLTVNSSKYVMGVAAKQLAKLQNENPFAFEAYHLLKKPKLEELKYNQKAIEEALINKHNEDAESELLAYLDTRLKIGDRKTPDELSGILQHGYNLYRIRNPKTGKIKVAYATQLMEAGRYKLDESKDTINGIPKKVFIIRHKYFKLAGTKKAA